MLFATSHWKTSIRDHDVHVLRLFDSCLVSDKKALFRPPVSSSSIGTTSQPLLRILHFLREMIIIEKKEPCRGHQRQRGLGMKLTELVDRFVVEEQKLTRYLLDETHKEGGPKAAFFVHYGFCSDEWSELKEALLQHALENEIVASRNTQYDSVIHSI